MYYIADGNVVDNESKFEWLTTGANVNFGYREGVDDRRPSCVFVLVDRPRRRSRETQWPG